MALHGTISGFSIATLTLKDVMYTEKTIDFSRHHMSNGTIIKEIEPLRFLVHVAVPFRIKLVYENAMG